MFPGHELRHSAHDADASYDHGFSRDQNQLFEVNCELLRITVRKELIAVTRERQTQCQASAARTSTLALDARSCRAIAVVAADF
jgi:hypothetical protein